MVSLPDGEKISKISLFVLAQLRNVTDRQTDGHRVTAIAAICIASHGNKIVRSFRLIVQTADTLTTGHSCPTTLSFSRMRVIYHNWSATKQRPHPQSVAEISRHSVLSGDRIRQCETSSGSRHKDTDQCL